MTEAIDRFARYVATLGRGPGRSRALTRLEAADAMGMLLRGEADRMQVGAFLMLLRYRGEDASEIAGLVEGARPATRVPDAGVDLDWPSYGAGRTRGAPWFLLSALALAAAGVRVLMHGTNAFSGGMTVAAAMSLLGLPVAEDVPGAQLGLARTNFAYMPVRALCPRIDELLGVRRLLGLRSPINTVARLLDPGDAPAGVDGVFHPPYIETHLAAAEILGRPRLLVLKGGGGEAERNPRRSVAVHVWVGGRGRSEQLLQPLKLGVPDASEPGVAAIWRGEQRHEEIEARIVATIALGLLAMGRGGDDEAAQIWRDRPARQMR
jgi:anthranilate phosphoribosyltransferase